MRLVSISISNIRSFRFDQNFQNEIKFDTSGLNLIIGPNASGKSNLIEIVMRIFGSIYDIGGTSYSSNIGGLDNLTRVTPSLSAIQNEKNLPGTFTKHRATPNALSSIKLKVKLDKNDIENLKLIQANRSLLQAIFNRYIQDDGRVHIFSDSFTVPRTGSEYEIVLEEVRGEHSSKFVEKDATSPAAIYLRDYGLACLLIDSYNELLHASRLWVQRSNALTHNYQATVDALGIRTGAKPIPRLTPPIILMSVQDRLNDINLDYWVYEANEGGDRQGINYKRRQLESGIYQKSTQGAFSSSSSESFDSVKNLIWRQCSSLVQDVYSVRDVVELINTGEGILTTFNSFLKHFGLSLSLVELSVEFGKLKFSLEENGHEVGMADISSGQRAIINIASTLLIGNEFKALVLIDEIENHLHPTIQAELRDAFVGASRLIPQSIAVTHSPIFVTAQTLNNTLRVYMRDGYSEVRRCKLSSKADVKSIVNVLDYTNGARVFFANKVLLVEGQSDQEFFAAYLRHHFNNNDIQVVDVGGKGQLQKWRNIIEDFGVRVWTLSDLDNAIKGRIERISTPKTKTVSYYENPLSWDDVKEAQRPVLEANIEEAAQSGDFILKNGTLESYVPGSGDKITRTRNFLAKNDWSTLKHAKELADIFKIIIRS